MIRFHRFAMVVFLLGLCARAGLAAVADEPISATFDAKGVKIHYLLQGKGEPVVLIHGLHSSAEMNWRMPGVMAALARDHMVIALDLPGHGQSDKPDKEDAYGLQMVEDVALLMDHLKVEKAHIVGYSMGGIVAVKFMVMHPERTLSGLDGGMGWLREGGMLQRVWARMPAQEGSRTPAVCIRSIGKLAVTADEIKGIKAPVEVVIGDRDPVKRLYVAPLQPVRKDWPVVEIKDAGHMDCIMKKEFRDAVTEWIAKQTAKPPAPPVVAAPKPQP